MRAIEQKAHTGHLGDGRIFVTPVDYCITLRPDGESFALDEL
jgi:nitrogen regulatory protein PII